MSVLMMINAQSQAMITANMAFHAINAYGVLASQKMRQASPHDQPRRLELRQTMKEHGQWPLAAGAGIPRNQPWSAFAFAIFRRS